MTFIALTNYGYAQMVVPIRIINYTVLYNVSLLQKSELGLFTVTYQKYSSNKYSHPNN